jgi:hypothetical protein
MNDKEFNTSAPGCRTVDLDVVFWNRLRLFCKQKACRGFMGSRVAAYESKIRV